MAVINYEIFKQKLDISGTCDDNPDMHEDIIRGALASFDLGKKLQSVHVQDGIVRVMLEVDRSEAARLDPIRIHIEKRLSLLPGVTRASVLLTTHREAPPQAAPCAPPAIKSLIAVGSGKGGVGKSTISANLAVALAQCGLDTGLLDADVYGPSLPRMLGVHGRPEVQDGQIIPLEGWGVKCMSIGLMVDEETPMIWRGPMVAGALSQMLEQVAWGSLDVLVIDLPPGTGDVQLTLTQKAALAGAVIVSTPQDIALIDARRAVRMFAQVSVPVFGVIENMSYFCCPNCQRRTEIFGHGGAAAEAARIGVPFLGEIPLLPAIRETGDAGAPIAASDPHSPAAAMFRQIAAGLAARLTAMPDRPRIRVED